MLFIKTSALAMPKPILLWGQRLALVISWVWLVWAGTCPEARGNSLKDDIGHTQLVDVLGQLTPNGDSVAISQVEAVQTVIDDNVSMDF